MKLKFAEMWSCDDNVCDCTQPRIYERSAGNSGEAAWTPPKLIDEGPFCSQATEAELIEQQAWLLAAARKYAVENLAEIEKRYAPTGAREKQR